MARKYAFKDYNPDRMARVFGSDISISPKHAMEICTALYNKTLEKAKDLLNDAIAMKTPINFRRFSHGAGHKRGVRGPGKFPVKASKEILKLLQSLEANAQQKGLNTESLVLVHARTNRASRPMHYGRQSGRMMKRSHVELIAEEKESRLSKPRVQPIKEQKARPEQKQEDRTEKKQETKPEPKPEMKKQEQKPESGAAGKTIKEATEAPEENRQLEKKTVPSGVKEKKEETKQKPKEEQTPKEPEPEQKKEEKPKSEETNQEKKPEVKEQ